MQILASHVVFLLSFLLCTAADVIDKFFSVRVFPVNNILSLNKKKTT